MHKKKPKYSAKAAQKLTLACSFERPLPVQNQTLKTVLRTSAYENAFTGTLPQLMAV